MQTTPKQNAPATPIDDAVLSEIFDAAPAPAVSFFQRTAEDRASNYGEDDRPPADLADEFASIVEASSAADTSEKVIAIIAATKAGEPDASDTSLRYWLANKFSREIRAISARTFYNGKVRLVFTDGEGTHEIPQDARRVVSQKLRKLQYAFAYARNLEVESRKTAVSTGVVVAAIGDTCALLAHTFSSFQVLMEPQEGAAWDAIQPMYSEGLSVSREQARKMIRK